ncbi:MAG: hypothetical protein U1G08_20790 [Verrucomicrobiota bacterium]
MEKFKRVQFGALSQLMNEIDDWCGTPPPRRFPPRPRGLRDVLVSVAIFHLADQISDAKARTQIQNLAGQIHDAGGRTIAG